MLTLLIPLAVILFADSFSLKAILNFSVGSIGISLGVGAILWYIEMSLRGFEDECEENTEIQDTNKFIREQSKVKDVDYGIEFTNEYNKQQQDMLNKVKTNTAIDILERNIAIKKIKGKKHNRLSKKLLELKESGLVDDTYKPIKFNDIISFDDTTNKKEAIGIDRIRYNPIWDGIQWKILLTFGKFTSIGTGLGLVIGSKIPLGSILLIFGIYILGLLYTTLKRYNNVRIKTAGKYLLTRRERLKLIYDMNTYIDNKLDNIKENDINE